jgi:hypothetical protein
MKIKINRGMVHIFSFLLDLLRGGRALTIALFPLYALILQPVRLLDGERQKNA